MRVKYLIFVVFAVEWWQSKFFGNVDQEIARGEGVWAGAAPQGGRGGGDRPPKGLKKREKNKIWGIFMH